MKADPKIITVTCLLFRTLIPFAQKTPLIETNSTSLNNTINSKITESLPLFTKGDWQYLITQNVGYTYLKNSLDNQSLGHQNQFNLYLGTNYFVRNRFGIGFDITGTMNGTHSNNYDITTCSWIGYGNMTYGIPLSENFGVYLRGGIGIGQINTTEKSGGNSTSNKINQFGYNFRLGAPIRAYEGGLVFLTPYVSYNHFTNTFSGGKEMDNRFGFGLNFESYLTCDEMECDCRHRFNLSRNMYKQGRSFFGYSTDGYISFGHTKTTDGGSGYSSAQQDYNSQALSISYYYYLLNYFALGAEFEFSDYVQKPQGTNDKFTTLGYKFTPMFQLNAPVDTGLKNAFIRAGVGIGSQKSESKINGSSTTIKQNIFTYCLDIGFNNFYSKNLSWTPKLGYDWNTYKNSDSNVKLKSNGFIFGIGLNAFF